VEMHKVPVVDVQVLVDAVRRAIRRTCPGSRPSRR